MVAPTRSWVWKHFRRSVDTKTVQCNSCKKVYKYRSCLEFYKIHLFRHHGIFNDDDHLKWNDDTHILWQHFKKQDNFKEQDKFLAKCKYCKYVQRNAFMKKNLERHLLKWHSEIIAARQEEIHVRPWLSKHIVWSDCKKYIKCRYCKWQKTTIFQRLDGIMSHLADRHNINENSSLSYVMQPSVAAENYADTSHHNENTYWQAPKNQAQQR